MSLIKKNFTDIKIIFEYKFWKLNLFNFINHLND